MKAAILGGIVLLAGCRFKGVESFETATTPVKFGHSLGDRYANGGVAYASAGTNVATRYGQGADANSPAKVDPKMDMPATGSGQEVGERGGQAAPGYANSNAPANQPGPAVGTANNH